MQHSTSRVAVTMIGAATLTLLFLVSGASNAAADGPAKPAPASKADKAQAADITPYMHNRRHDLLSTDFMLTHPRGEVPKGITAQEAVEIEAVIRAGCSEIISAQYADGRFDAGAKGLGISHMAGHAAAIWSLMLCGRSSKEPEIVRALASLLQLVDKRPGERGKDIKGNPLPDGPEGLSTMDLGLGLVALHAVLEARDREATEAAIKEGKEKERATDWVKSSGDVTKRGKELKKLLSADELKAATTLRAAILKRQDARSGRPYPPGGWDDHAVPEDAHVRATMFAMLGLLAAYRSGLEPPSADVCSIAVDFIAKAQQTFSAPYTIYTLDAKTVEAKKPPAKRAPSSVSAKAQGWDNDSTKPSGVAVGTYQYPEAGATAAAVTAMIICRFLATGGAPSGGGAASKSDAAIKGGLGWLVRFAEYCTDPKKNEKEAGASPGDRYPGGRGGELGRGDLGLALMCVVTGSETLGTREWYPDMARYWLVALKDLKEKGMPVAAGLANARRDAAERAKEASDKPAEKPAEKPEADKPAKAQMYGYADASFAPKEPPGQAKPSGEVKSAWPPTDSLTAMQLLVLALGLDKTPGGLPSIHMLRESGK